MAGSGRDIYDLCIIGCGPGGFAAAMRAVDLGKQVCLIEGGQLGGTAVMWGALASKTLWELAKDFAVASKTNRGYRCQGLTVDFQEVRNTVMRAVREKTRQMATQMAAFDPARCNGPGCLTLKRGWGRFVSRDTIAVHYAHGRRETVQARFFLIASGSRPRPFPGVVPDQRQILDSDGILRLKSFPKQMMIVGAGVTGCEYATIFSNFGQTQVYLVDHQTRILPNEDPDVSDYVSGHLARRNVVIYHSAGLQSVARSSDGLEVTLAFSDGHSKTVAVDILFVSIGREPNLSLLNLEAAGIKPHARGYLETDPHLKVSETIYAAGDVTNHPSLVNMAEMEARYAVRHMFGCKTRPLNYRNMSTVMFFYPAVAAVGLNEKQCREKQIAYRVGVYDNALLPRAIAMRATSGFVKIIVADNADQTILGMRAVGPQSSSTIMSIALLMDQGKGMAAVLESLHPHPTMSEGIQECLRLLQGKSAYKPQTFPQWLKIRTWHPENDRRSMTYG
jgi:dihydrolipoamide dehydrogenase